MDIGVTYVQTQGAYSKKEGKALYCVGSQSEVTEVKRIITKCDKRDFVSILDVNEVVGEGFTYDKIN